MKHFLYRLIPPRPTFPADITPDEAAIMQQHVQYWSEVMSKGKVIAFGPVADPRGSYGIGIIRLGDSDDPFDLANKDPAIKAAAGFTFEVHPMPKVICNTQSA